MDYSFPFPPSLVSPCTILFAITESDLPSEQFQSMIEWLKHNVAPSSRVNSFMEKTAVKRAEWIRKNHGQSFHNILKEYPCSLTQHGELISVKLIDTNKDGYLKDVRLDITCITHGKCTKMYYQLFVTNNR